MRKWKYLPGEEQLSTMAWELEILPEGSALFCEAEGLWGTSRAEAVGAEQ